MMAKLVERLTNLLERSKDTDVLLQVHRGVQDVRRRMWPEFPAEGQEVRKDSLDRTTSTTYRWQ